jgi:hypothetical protein
MTDGDGGQNGDVSNDDADGDGGTEGGEQMNEHDRQLALDDEVQVSLFLVIFGYFWLFLVIFGYFWLFLVIFGYFGNPRTGN